MASVSGWASVWARASVSASGSAWARSCSPAAAKAIARQPSTKARMVVSMRRTSACSMIGICGAAGSRTFIDRPWGRTRAYSTDSWYAAEAVAAALTPTRIRASFIIWNM